MIVMVSGATQIGGTLYTPDSGPFEAAPETEARLVRRGAARYTGDTAQAPALAAQAGQDENLDTLPCGNMANEENPAEGQEATQSEELEQTLDGMKVSELRAIAKGLGIQGAEKMSKARLIGAIDKETSGEEEPPILDVLEPEA